jgi:hypothetical protein
MKKKTTPQAPKSTPVRPGSVKSLDIEALHKDIQKRFPKILARLAE